MNLVQPLPLQSSQRNLEAEWERGKRRQYSPWHCSEGASGLGSEQDEQNCAATPAEVLLCAQPELSPSSGFAFYTS